MDALIFRQMQRDVQKLAGRLAELLEVLGQHEVATLADAIPTGVAVDIGEADYRLDIAIGTLERAIERAHFARLSELERAQQLRKAAEQRARPIARHWQK